MKTILLFIIKIYQKAISPDTGALSFIYPKGCCRFYPRCSDYSYQAINKYGAIKGIFLSLKRLIRCHPFNHGGFDPLK